MFVQLRGCFFSKQFHLHPPKSQDPQLDSNPKKRSKTPADVAISKTCPTPPNQQNQQNPPFFGFHKKSGWMKTTFPPGLWSSGSFHSKWSNAWSHGHSPRTRPGHAMVRVRWLKGWLETDGRRGWEIKQKTLGGWRLLVMLVHGIRSDVFFYMTFVGGWQLNFGCLMLYLPQNGWFIIMENPIKMDDLGVPLFSETPIWYE